MPGTPPMTPARPASALAVALAVATAGIATGGCATSLSTMQPYETLKPGAIHVSSGFSINAPISATIRSVKTAVELGARLAEGPRRDGGTVHYNGIRSIGADDWARVGAAAMAVALTTPGYNQELMFRIGVIEDVDVGVRWAWSTARLDGKVQIYRYKPSRRFDMGLSLDLGVGYHFFDGLVFDILEFIDIESFRRVDGEASLIFGASWGTYDAFQFWVGPKIMLSHYHVDGNLAGLCELGGEVCTPEDFRLVNADDTNGGMGLYGGFLGFAAGYRWIWFVAEITAMWMVASHHVLPGLVPEETDLGGLVIFPSAGFMGRFDF